MKKFSQLFLVLLSLVSCSKPDLFFSYPNRELTRAEQLKVSAFEKNYIGRITPTETSTKSESKDSITLIGFKTVAFHGPDSVFVNTLWESYKEEIAAYGSFLTLDGQARIYFPMSEAIVKVNGIKYIADSNGVIALPLSDYERVFVIGRNKTDKSVYTRFRRVYKANESFNNGHILVFDLGFRPLMNEHDPDKLTDGEGGDVGISCTHNHGSYANCTVAYMIAQPRCVTDYSRCMDYNGFGTDCSGNKLFFIGSDCSVALSMGYCWNEVMD